MSSSAAAPVSTAARSVARRHWSLDDIPWRAIRRDLVARDDTLFYLVATASLMESATDLYTANLIDHFAGDAEITCWLEQHWLPEELQHGRALRRYVETAWPDFPWDAVRGPFVAEFSPLCDEALEPVRGLEMASRCVVEMGTATYYTTLSRGSPDPVLAQLTRRIVEDEVRHYKHFYRYFRRYREAEGLGRAAVAPALWRRLKMTGGEDSFVVLKHVYAARNPGQPFDIGIYCRLRRQCRDALRAQFPHRMGIRMLLKPLGLGPLARCVAEPLLTAVAQRMVP